MSILINFRIKSNNIKKEEEKIKMRKKIILIQMKHIQQKIARAALGDEVYGGKRLWMAGEMGARVGLGTDGDEGYERERE